MKVKYIFFSLSAYEFAQKISDLEECKTFPPISEFYNTLRGEGLSLNAYDESLNIFKKFNFCNMKEYMEAYCMIDVYLLAEVFTKFRKETLANFDVDPCNFISLPGMGMECFLKKSEIEMEYIYNGNYIIFFFSKNFPIFFISCHQ